VTRSEKTGEELKTQIAADSRREKQQEIATADLRRLKRAKNMI